MPGRRLASCGRLEENALLHAEPAAEPVDQAHGKAPHGRRMTRRDPTLRIEPEPDYYLIGGPFVGRAVPKGTSLPRHAIGAHHGDMLIEEHIKLPLAVPVIPLWPAEDCLDLFQRHADADSIEVLPGYCRRSPHHVDADEAEGHASHERNQKATTSRHLTTRQI